MPETVPISPGFVSTNALSVENALRNADREITAELLASRRRELAISRLLESVHRDGFLGFLFEELGLQIFGALKIYQFQRRGKMRSFNFFRFSNEIRRVFLITI